MRQVWWHLCGRFWAVMAGRAWEAGDYPLARARDARSEEFFRRIVERV